MKIEQIPFFGELQVPDTEIEDSFYSTFPQAEELFGNKHDVEMVIWVTAWEASRLATIDKCIEKVKAMRPND